MLGTLDLITYISHRMVEDRERVPSYGTSRVVPERGLATAGGRGPARGGKPKFNLVPGRGLEPPHLFRYQLLRLACLPISPPRRIK